MDLKKPALEAKKVAELKKLADSVFSKYIRRKDGDLCTCYTCGKVSRWQDMQCGHLFSRSKLPIRYDERNVRVQCESCNMWKNGNYQEYFPRMIDEVGADAINQLRMEGGKKIKASRQWYVEIIEKYKAKLEEIENGD